jgi:TonB family protein
MRLHIVIAMFALCTAQAASAQTPLGVDAFVFGMSVDEARAASDGAEWEALETSEIYQTFGVERHVRIGTMDYLTMLEFQNGRLVSIEHGRPRVVSSVAECNAEVAATMRELESGGVFAGERAPWEPASGAIVTRTEAGSEMRSYPANEDGNSFTYANRRGALFVQAQGVHAIRRLGETGPEVEGCLVLLHYELDPFAPTPVRADAPTRAELDAASTMPGVPWLEQPDGQKIYAHYPRIALASGIEGRVQLDCLIAANGRLRCAVVSEEPLGLGFGAAALSVADEFRAAEQVDGAPTIGRRVRRSIAFRLED